jgi:hypothetical protein
LERSLLEMFLLAMSRSKNFWVRFLEQYSVLELLKPCS